MLRRLHPADTPAKSCVCPADHGSVDRRRLLSLASLATGVSLLATKRPAWASGHAEALLLSCMDYRLLDDIVTYMNGRGMMNSYDHFILAGASLGALLDKQADWGQAFWDHVETAKRLHAIHKIILLDHRDCGAYRVFLGVDYAKDPAAETAVHAANLKKLAGLVREKFEGMEVETLLMALDGSVETIQS